MSNEWKDCSSLQELAAAQARGDEIDVYASGEWSIWDETVWHEREEYRCRPAKGEVSSRYPIMLDPERAKYVTREVQYEDEIRLLRQQIVMLRDGVAMAVSIIGHPDDDGTKHLQKILTDTADLEGLRLCHANPIAWVTTDEEGSPAMLFFDRQEALMFSGDDGPVPLYKEANNRRRQAGALRRSGEPKEQGK